MEKNAKIYVAGHTGLVGSALVRALNRLHYEQVVMRTREELDLNDPEATAKFFADEKPDYAIIAAAHVGGIMENDTYPADFIYDNLRISMNIIHNAYTHGVKKLLYLGSACIYPRESPQPIKEEYFMTGPLEPTNEAYATAKIAGIEMCKAYNRQYGTNFISAMPTNLYGPNDNFDLKSSHVLPALLRKFHEAKEAGSPTVILWGTGRPTREFLYVDDAADALIFLMNKYNDSNIINIGTGKDISIAELAAVIKEVVGYNGTIVYDTSKPDGQPRRRMDVSRLHSLGYRHQTNLREGIAKTYQWYCQQTTVSAHVPAAAAP
ncbi:MAG: GDP-fucose synthetase [Candidatus Andersenbacteria bacterium CG10_big_fil_rev_8_21_14_0_10_54_11]|uniref:GDP-L-fucose synthase n=1 Tax=Candidatus Andersenbacteria bacterium CG10_big_fil_rev_8_21_14_0_10_54_11 TaxID=1974485 RepID=A0A2M6WZ77_9BACT|nr:MAG: GDP-fucose synthetase [Candidatus Andersenbacteria bacterium CG10_big_fil_rev_8_21_14_0_10_54_11]